MFLFPENGVPRPARLTLTDDRAFLASKGIDPSDERVLLETLSKSSPGRIRSAALSLIVDGGVGTTLSVPALELLSAGSHDDCAYAMHGIMRLLGRQGIEIFRRAARDSDWPERWGLYSDALWHWGNDEDVVHAIALLRKKYARPPRSVCAGWSTPATVLLTFIACAGTDELASAEVKWYLSRGPAAVRADGGTVGRVMPECGEPGLKWLCIVGRCELASHRFYNRLHWRYPSIGVLPVEIDGPRRPSQLRRASRWAGAVVAFDDGDLEAMSLIDSSLSELPLLVLQRPCEGQVSSKTSENTPKALSTAIESKNDDETERFLDTLEN